MSNYDYIIEFNLSREVIRANIVENDLQIDAYQYYNFRAQSQNLSGSLFIIDVTSDNIVSNKTYVSNTIPENSVIESCVVDGNATIYFIAESGSSFSPIVTLEDVPCDNLQQFSDDRRLFYGSFTVLIDENKDITLISGDSSASVTITKAPAGPEILTAIIGSYPGSQTEAKEDDVVSITGTVNESATHIRMIDFEGFKSSDWIELTGDGTFSISGTISEENGVKLAKLEAKNQYGVIGSEKNSDNTILLNQTIPTFIDNGITYPATQGAFKLSEIGYKDTQVLNYDSILYSSPSGDFSIANASIYEQNKEITCLNPGTYNDSVINFKIEAHKESNDTTAIFEIVVYVADIAPIVSVSQSTSRLRSEDTYTITAISDQALSSVPDISIPISGTWQGVSFVDTGDSKTFVRDILIASADVKGVGAWGFISVPKNLAGIDATIIGNQNVGGFIQLQLSLSPYQNTVQLDEYISDTSKLIMSWDYKDNMIYKPIGTSPPVSLGWTIDAVGVNPTTIIILDTQATSSSSQTTTITIEETV